MTRYRTIVADPPWDVQRIASPGAKGFGTSDTPLPSIRLPYRTMSTANLAALPIGELADPDAHLYLWTINRYIEQAYGIARAWGFQPKTLLVWAKAPMGIGKAPMGIGPGGAYSITTEYVLYATRGSLPATSRADRTWWSWPRGKHSAKPDAFLDIVEQVSPGPYLELFARRARFGWDYAGNESLGTVHVEGLAP